MSLPISFTDGSEGEVTKMDGERLELVSERAFAPGARFEGRASGLSLKLKAIRSVRQGEQFVVLARFVDLRRETREALEAALAD